MRGAKGVTIGASHNGRTGVLPCGMLGETRVRFSVGQGHAEARLHKRYQYCSGLALPARAQEAGRSYRLGMQPDSQGSWVQCIVQFLTV